MQATTMQATTTQESVRSDHDLIEAARRGEHYGFEQLVQRYQNRLFSSMRSDVGSATIAEDIVQEAFVRAFRHLDTFKHESNFYTWLYRIALNSRRPYLRHRGATVPLDVAGEMPSQCRSEIRDSPANRAERSEELQQVRAAIARLPEDHRRILILREFEGFDYQSIADVLHVKTGTVRSRLARARARLRKELTDYMNAKPMAAGAMYRRDENHYACSE